MTKDQLAAILTTDKSHLAISVPNITHLSREAPPTQKVDRLRLLEVLIGSTPKSLCINLNTIEFSFLVSKGCFIPPQLNPHSGTWIRCITGQINYMSMPSSQFTEDDRSALRTDPVKWQRSGDGLQKFVHVPIGPGQAFLTPVANPSVMIFYFPKASCEACGHPAAAKFKQPSPEQLLAILEEFRIVVNAHLAAFTQTCTLEELQTDLQGALKKVREKVVGERELHGELETMSERVDDERRDSAST
ncbi:hypothetical protein LTR15_004740 [Elasticomyces elasticus]|nr:hypothetical protein LTR15_004740 [Elasticomyces elasticus]